MTQAREGGEGRKVEHGRGARSGTGRARRAPCADAHLHQGVQRVARQGALHARRRRRLRDPGRRLDARRARRRSRPTARRSCSAPRSASSSLELPAGAVGGQPADLRRPRVHELPLRGAVGGADQGVRARPGALRQRARRSPPAGSGRAPSGRRRARSRSHRGSSTSAGAASTTVRLRFAASSRAPCGSTTSTSTRASTASRGFSGRQLRGWGRWGPAAAVRVRFFHVGVRCRRVMEETHVRGAELRWRAPARRVREEMHAIERGFRPNRAAALGQSGRHARQRARNSPRACLETATNGAKRTLTGVRRTPASPPGAVDVPGPATPHGAAPISRRAALEGGMTSPTPRPSCWSRTTRPPDVPRRQPDRRRLRADRGRAACADGLRDARAQAPRPRDRRPRAARRLGGST